MGWEKPPAWSALPCLRITAKKIITLWRRRQIGTADRHKLPINSRHYGEQAEDVSGRRYGHSEKGRLDFWLPHSHDMLHREWGDTVPPVRPAQPPPSPALILPRTTGHRQPHPVIAPAAAASIVMRIVLGFPIGRHGSPAILPIDPAYFRLFCRLHCAICHRFVVNTTFLSQNQQMSATKL